MHPYWHARRTNLQTQVLTDTARKALDAADLIALRDALGRLLAESFDIASALTSTFFVEDFLAMVLAQGKQALAVQTILRELGFGRHARPLLLAYEAAVANRPDMLGELEPEVQVAAKHMFDRLTGQAKKRKQRVRKAPKGEGV